MRVQGKKYRLVVLRVLEWDQQGRPSKVAVGYDDTTFDLSDENVPREFWTAYVPEEIAKPREKH